MGKGWEYVTAQGLVSEPFRLLREARKEAREEWFNSPPRFRRVGTVWWRERQVRVSQSDGSDGYPAGSWRWRLSTRYRLWSDGGYPSRAVAREKGRCFARSLVMTPHLTRRGKIPGLQA